MRTDHHPATAKSGDWRGMLRELGRIASDSASLADGLDAAVEAIGTRLGCSLGFVYLVRGGGRLECHSVWVAGTGKRPMHCDPDRPVDFSLPREALATGAGQWSDLEGGSEQGGAHRRAFALPVLALGGAVAVLELVGEHPRAKLTRLDKDAHLIGVLLGRLADSDHVADAVAGERRRIGRELHDSVGQQLSGLGMYARSLANAKDTNPEELRAQLDLLATGLKEAHAEVRALSHDLAASRQGSQGLARALVSVTERTSRQCDTTCSFVGDRSLDVTDERAATHLLRIAQEALSNAVRHGHAHTVEVDLHQRRGGLTLQIKDDGCGIPPDVGAADGIGLANMRERAREVGADLTIRSAGHHGTVVTCSLPKGAH